LRETPMSAAAVAAIRVSSTRPRQNWTTAIIYAHVSTMFDKAPPAGWVVQVVIPVQSGEWIGATLPDAPSSKYYNAAFAVAGKAIEAARQLAVVGEGSAVRALSSAEIAALGLQPGEVKPRMTTRKP
jgi:hypothetical protein